MSGVFGNPRTTGSILISNLPEPDWPIYEYTRDGANTAFNAFEIVDPPSVTTITSPAPVDPQYNEDFNIYDGSYLGLTLAYNGKMYSPPWSANAGVMVIDPVTNTANIVSFGVSSYTSRQSYKTGALAPNGKIYCPPWNPGYDKGILVLDPASNTSYNIQIDPAPAAGTAYASAVLGANGKIYCLGVRDALIINPANDTWIRTTFGGVIPTATGASDRWVSGVKSLANDKLYFVSLHANYNYLIEIDTSTGGNGTATRKNFGLTKLASGQRYNGIANGRNGFLNLIPHNSGYWAYVNPVTNVIYEESSPTNVLSRGAVSGDDGGVYSIPYTGARNPIGGEPNASFVYNRTGNVGDVDTGLLNLDLDTLDPREATWWGGCLAPNGKIYSLPDMAYWVTTKNDFMRKEIIVLDPGGNAIQELGTTNFRTLIDTSYFNKGGT